MRVVPPSVSSGAFMPCGVVEVGESRALGVLGEAHSCSLSEEKLRATALNDWGFNTGRQEGELAERKSECLIDAIECDLTVSHGQYSQALAGKRNGIRQIQAHMVNPEN